MTATVGDPVRTFKLLSTYPSYLELPAGNSIKMNA
ncbi:hypothetical protein PF003_g27182 [Phytophthora fragariae]|nr:hypothetical protein PF003_g27182 [Phytophthora fragariae]